MMNILNESAGYDSASEVFNSLSDEERKLVSPNHPDKFLDSPNLVYRYIYKVDGKPAGFVEAYSLSTGRGRSSKIVYITIAVNPKYRGTGAAKKMLLKAIDNLRSKGYDKIQYRCAVTNTGSIATANSCGFEMVKQTTNQYIFEKRLQEDMVQQPNDIMQPPQQ